MKTIILLVTAGLLFAGHNGQQAYNDCLLRGHTHDSCFELTK